MQVPCGTSLDRVRDYAEIMPSDCTYCESTFQFDRRLGGCATASSSLSHGKVTSDSVGSASVFDAATAFSRLGMVVPTRWRSRLRATPRVRSSRIRKLIDVC
jgi:hypothetical protein